MNPYLGQLRSAWENLAERERRMLALGGGVLCLIVFYLLLWEPLRQARIDKAEALAQARILATRLELMAVEAQRGDNGGRRATSTGQSLLAVVDQSGKSSQLGKPPVRLQPEGDNTVKVWLEEVPFEAVLRWLHELQTRHGVRVDNADFERQTTPGLVNVRVTLVRNQGQP
ncbi:MAG: type II secretion system protein M [Nevskiales bacterium]|nr:type II secretion system protein M [Nevskiales bacterium]